MSTDIYPELTLYNLTLQPSSSAIKCCIGNFTGNRRQQEIIRATNTSLELWKLNKKTGSLTKVLAQETFSTIRSISNFKTTGSSKENLIITSDSGNLTIVEFDSVSNKFASASNQPYFKTGIRRISPGDFVAVDGKGRSAMIGAIEKNRFVYTFKKDSNDNLVVSSPLEASKSKMLTFDLCGLDVGFENPIFASIEYDYSNAESRNNNSNNDKSEPNKILSYYELDLGLNHVVLKHSEEIRDSSNFLVPIPGGIDGPSGLLVCSKNMVQYKYLSKMGHNIPIPRRFEQQSRDSQIVAGVVHKLKSTFFVLLQNDLGDVFKVTLDYIVQDSDESKGEGGLVNSIEIKYFDSMPICTSLLIFKAGFLYANCESGDQYIYQFEKLGDDPDDKVYNSSNYPDEIACLEDNEDHYFEVKPFDNLNLVNIIENLNPLIDSKLYDSGNSSDLPVMYSLCGSSSRSSLKILNHELSFNEIVSQELPSKISKVFATKLNKDDEFDKFMVLTFLDSTLILSIGDEVEEIENSGFETGTTTLDVQQIGQTSVIQIYPEGFKQIFYKDGEPVKDILWSSPPGLKVLHSSCTNTQVAIGLSNRVVVYFEINEHDQLVEYSERLELDSQIVSISIGEIPEGNFRFPYIIAGCNDQSLTILSTNPETTLNVISKEVLSSNAHSLLICSMTNSMIEVNEEDDGDDNTSKSSNTSVFVHIGMENGVYARLQMDLTTGELSNPRNKYTGPKAVSLAKVNVLGQNVISILSTRTYIGYNSISGFKIIPLIKPIFQSMCPFKSEDLSENGLLSIYDNNLTIMTVDHLDNDFLIESIPLRYTPKSMSDCTDLNGMLYLVESDYQIESPFIEDDLQSDQQEEIVTYDIDETKQGYYQQFGYKFNEDTWGSCLQVISIENKAIGQTIELTHESLFKVVKVNFSSRPNDNYLVVSSALNQKLNPNTNTESFLRTYKIAEDGSLAFLHKTKTESLALSLIQFQNKLLVGFKDCLTLYDIGLKQLLKKASITLTACNQIVDLQSQGFRVIVSDIRNSIRYIVYKPLENKFVEFIDDTIQRHVTKTVMLDYDTVLGGDRFGNLFILRCPKEISELSDADNHGALINRVESKLANLFNFYLGDIPTSFEKGSLIIGGSSNMVLYTCLQGKIGCLNPLRTLTEINFFKELQKFMIEEFNGLTDRDYLKFKSYYVPIKGCIDGDLIEQFYKLDTETRNNISNKMDRVPMDIDRRISEMRNRVSY